MRQVIGGEEFQLYICGRSECMARIFLPVAGDTQIHIHRDKNGLRCHDMLVAFDITETAREERMAWAWKRRSILERYRRDKGLPDWLPVAEVYRRMKSLHAEDPTASS